MTTYALPTDAPIGTVLYHGDLVWFNGVVWAPIVIGTMKLNEVAAEVVADEAIVDSDRADLQAQIDALTLQIEFLNSKLETGV